MIIWIWLSCGSWTVTMLMVDIIILFQIFMSIQVLEFFFGKASNGSPEDIHGDCLLGNPIANFPSVLCKKRRCNLNSSDIEEMKVS